MGVLTIRARGSFDDSTLEDEGQEQWPVFTWRVQSVATQRVRDATGSSATDVPGYYVARFEPGSFQTQRMYIKYDVDEGTTTPAFGGALVNAPSNGWHSMKNLFAHPPAVGDLYLFPDQGYCHLDGSEANGTDNNHIDRSGLFEYISHTAVSSTRWQFVFQKYVKAVVNSHVASGGVFEEGVGGRSFLDPSRDNLGDGIPPTLKIYHAQGNSIASTIWLQHSPSNTVPFVCNIWNTEPDMRWNATAWLFDPTEYQDSKGYYHQYTQQPDTWGAPSARVNFYCPNEFRSPGYELTRDQQFWSVESRSHISNRVTGGVNYGQSSIVGVAYNTKPYEHAVTIPTVHHRVVTSNYTITPDVRAPSKVAVEVAKPSSNHVYLKSTSKLTDAITAEPVINAQGNLQFNSTAMIQSGTPVIFIALFHSTESLTPFENIYTVEKDQYILVQHNTDPRVNRLWVFPANSWTSLDAGTPLIWYRARFPAMLTIPVSLTPGVSNNDVLWLQDATTLHNSIWQYHPDGWVRHKDTREDVYAIQFTMTTGTLANIPVTLRTNPGHKTGRKYDLDYTAHSQLNIITTPASRPYTTPASTIGVRARPGSIEFPFAIGRHALALHGMIVHMRSIPENLRARGLGLMIDPPIFTHFDTMTSIQNSHNNEPFIRCHISGQHLTTVSTRPGWQGVPGVIYRHRREHHHIANILMHHRYWFVYQDTAETLTDDDAIQVREVVMQFNWNGRYRR